MAILSGGGSYLLLVVLLVVSSVEMENNLGTLFLSRIAAINFDESSILPSAAAAAAVAVLFGATLPLIIWSRLPK